MGDTKEWDEVASGRVDTPRRITRFFLYRRGDRWRVVVTQKSSDDVVLYHDTEGRANYPEDACGQVRKDVFAWCETDNVMQAEYATALRAICYAAEDAAVAPS